MIPGSSQPAPSAPSRMIPFAAVTTPLDQDEAGSLRLLGTPLDPGQRDHAGQLAAALVRGSRARADERPYLDAFLGEFGLSNPEGIALMCLAEALLRIPDDATADRLIAEKLSAGDWAAHAGRSGSLFVNASTWGLMLTGRMVELPEEIHGDVQGWLRRLGRRAGDPVIRLALRRAMQIIGSEFVVGRDIGEALARCGRDPDLGLCSFDMLGEGARTDLQARQYMDAYATAIQRVAEQTQRRGESGATPERIHGVSIKLSALAPCFQLAKQEQVASRLIPHALELARLAARHGLGLTVDAEEADRLEVSLQVVAALAADPVTRDWSGLGMAVQAYGRGASAVLRWVENCAADSGRSMSVRLVKGAYWDAEIKRSQERGLSHYPVYTCKAYTDLSYLACARQLFAARGRLFPQFATHNAHTLAAVMALRPDAAPCEFQRLHGMGRLLYDEAQRQCPQLPPVRVYAPVGPHASLLAYLVRRLLENGANTSFVNRFMDAEVPVEAVVADPLSAAAQLQKGNAVVIPLPVDLFGAARRNSRGVDFGRSRDLAALRVATQPRSVARVAELHGGRENAVRERVTIRNPANRRECVGAVDFATANDVRMSMHAAGEAQKDWDASGAAARARILERAADLFEAEQADLLHLLVRESGKALHDAVAEIRETVDFCRYYAALARQQFQPVALMGPTGEANTLSLQGRGAMVCISPWNFPLAIFTGQVAASLVAGNAVVAKPSELTPLIALRATSVLHRAGVPSAVLHCLPMVGRKFGEMALADPCLAGVVFTGSTATAQWLNRALAARDGPILPLIAETGGINAMLVDSTALPEQVVDDVMASAFGSAGQRCSALRLLCIQDDVANSLLELIEGAMDELILGDPSDPATDLGPVISSAAAASLESYIAGLQGSARIRKRVVLTAHHAYGSFVAPTLIEVQSPAQVVSEQFGPVLHVCRFDAARVGEMLAAIRASGYALTMGVQTRIEGFWQNAFAATGIGNVYVNRNMVGAVVGVQPFGGSGLSGTGPKAGGPHYLARLATERTLTVNTTAVGGNAQLLIGRALQ